MVHECVGGGESHCVDLIDLTLFDSKLKINCAANYAPATKVVHMLVYTSGKLCRTLFIVNNQQKYFSVNH